MRLCKIMKKNFLQNKLNELESVYERKRGSGRTTKMLLKIINIITKESDKKIVILAQDQITASFVKERMKEILTESEISFEINANHLSVNGNMLMFKSEIWTETPGYKYNKWDYVFEDNSIVDKIVEERLSCLALEIKALDI